MDTNQVATPTATVNEMEFRTGIMPRAQLSMLASQLAVAKATHKDAKEFAGLELMEATAVVDVLKEVGTPAPPISADSEAFITKLKGLDGQNFDKTYMKAELDNHEYLRNLAQNYLNSKGNSSDGETRRLAKIALFAFTEHVLLCKKINGELNG